MLTKRIIFKSFKIKKTNIEVKQKLKSLIREKNSVLHSLSKNYIDSFSKKKIIWI